MTDIYEIWDRYEKSKTYMDKKRVHIRTEKNWLMYIGKQWEACDDSEGMEDLPSMNFIKPTVKYKVSSVASTKVTALFSDMNGENADVVERLNALFDVSWEKAKMAKMGKKTLRDAAVQGDAYLFWGEGGDTRKTPQLIHNTQMRLGDENINNIQDQPWIIIEERLSVDVVRERAKRAGVSAEQLEEIKPDKQAENSLVNQEEVKDKITSLLYMEKDRKTGVVSVGRCTRDVMYEKLRPVQQSKGGEWYGHGLTMYPIVALIWEDIPNDARGVSEVEQLIPNQLELNKMLARRAISAKLTAFPRLAYDDSSLANPEALNNVGAAVKLNGGNAQAIGNMIAYLAPQSMSPDAQTLCDELLNQSRTLAGASDAQLGNIDLSRVSGTAAQTVRDQQQLPLNEQQETYQDFIENIALLWFELWKVYFPLGIEMDGVTVEPEELATVVPNVRVDIAEDTALSKMAAQQELTNLFNNGKLTFEEYVEAYPEHSSIPKETLRQIVFNRQQKMAMGQPLVDEFGNPIDISLGGGVNMGGMSGGSMAGGGGYQALQSQLAERPIVE